MATFVPNGTVYEMRLIAERYVCNGINPEEADVERLTRIRSSVGHCTPIAGFAEELVALQVRKGA